MRDSPREPTRATIASQRPLRCGPIWRGAVSAAGLTAALVITVDAIAAAADPPNVVLIVADDLGYSDLGCYGGEIATPTLDGLAKNGLRFTQFYNTARCWPSRAAILTGYYAQQVRRDTIPGVKSGSGGARPEWARLLPDMLRPLGYRSYHSGKWHIDGDRLAGGFDRSYSIEDHNRFFSPQNHLEDDKPLPAVKPGSGFYITTAIADRAIGQLREHAERHAGAPFFSFVAFTAPHFPLQAPANDVARYRDRFRDGWDAARSARWQRMRQMGLVNCELSPLEREVGPPYHFADALRALGPGETNRPIPWTELADAQRELQAAKMAVHAAMVDRMDREIGRIVEQLRTMRALDNTLVLFLSDNGASAEIMVRGDGHDPTAPAGSAATFLCLGPGWSSAANTPFRRHKTWVHEGGIATPLIAHWPKGIGAHGELRHVPGHVIDLVPTILEAAGARRLETWNGKPVPPAPGRSLVPAFAKEASLPRDYLWWLHEGNRALRVGDHKLVSAKSDGAWELYDLANDRSETRNLAASMPEKVREMEATWSKALAEFRALATRDIEERQPKNQIPAGVRELMEAPRYRQAHWGLLVADVKTGDVRYELNSERLFAPASVTKCFSVAAALDALGADFRFETPVVRRGEIDEKGELAGDLILVASGDLTFGGRTTDSGEIAFVDGDHTYANGLPDGSLTPQDPLAGLNDLARQVAERIRRVRGDVIIDDRMFEPAVGTGSGPGRLTPIYVNDNLIDFLVEPTEPGKPAKVTWRPQSAALRVQIDFDTVEKDGGLETWIRDHGSGRIHFHGRIPAGHRPVVRVYEVPDGAAHSRTLFIEALERSGVAVDAPTFGENPAAKLPPRDATTTLHEVAKHTSLPFAENAKLILKVSHNLHASTLPLLLAAKRGQRTLGEGLKLQGQFLERAGVDVRSISFGGGAGGARSDYVTPRATVQLLRHMATRPDFDVYRRGMPRIGIDGTLARAVGGDSPAKDRVQAKTGTLLWDNVMNGNSLLTSKALAGYLTTAQGETLAFALFVNHVPLVDGMTPATVGQDLGRICEMIVTSSP